jgi:hypothetical protein
VTVDEAMEIKIYHLQGIGTLGAITRNPPWTELFHDTEQEIKPMTVDDMASKLTPETLSLMVSDLVNEVERLRGLIQRVREVNQHDNDNVPRLIADLAEEALCDLV